MRYKTYADDLKQRYGEKVYKLPINIKATCPNRDGTKGTGGCIFCGDKGAGLENLPAGLTITEQLEKNIEYIGKRYGADKYIAYFQNFTNTYIPVQMLTACAREAAAVHDIVELAFSTRPDCIPDGHLEALQEIKRQTGRQISIELGLQTANYHTLQKVDRGHSLAEFIDAMMRIKAYGFLTGVHVILNLPGDDRSDVIETAKIISVLKADHVKLHSLYIEKNSELCRMYQKGEFEIASMEEYIERVILFLEHLREETVVSRIASRAPSKDTVFCNWGTAWWKIRDRIEEIMEERDTRQGVKCGYLEPCEIRQGERLVLWDIDGTLMHCGSDGTKALNQAFEELYGIQGAMAGAGIGSAMDCAIVDRIMTHFSVPLSEKEKVIEVYVKKLKKILAHNEGKRILPGVKEILEITKKTSGLHAAILTSNFKAGAETKLRSVGLWEYFEIGGFGDHEGEKWHAAEMAAREAETRYGCRFEKENIFIIGDSIYDVDCAKMLGYKSIAVATGWLEKEALHAHEPDYLFDDLSNYQEIIQILTGKQTGDRTNE